MTYVESAQRLVVLFSNLAGFSTEILLGQLKLTGASQFDEAYRKMMCSVLHVAD